MRCSACVDKKLNVQTDISLLSEKAKTVAIVVATTAIVEETQRGRGNEMYCGKKGRKVLLCAF